MARRLRRDHDHVVSLRRRDAAEMDVEPVREQHRGARLEIRRHLLVPHLLLHVVGEKQRHHLCAAHSVGDGTHLEARVLRRLLGRAALAQADLHLGAGVAQVERVRVPLTPVADHGHFPGEEIEVALAIDGCHEAPFLG